MLEFVTFGGWRCVRMLSGDAEILVTLDVGPRIIRLGFVGGPNQFHVKEADLGQVGGDEYRGYGGHRLWIAPEDRVRTYQPDNEPVQLIEEANAATFASATDRFGIQKAIRIQPLSDGQFVIDHIVTNHSGEFRALAPWALSVMATGGVCLVPQEPYVSHGDALLPARPVVLWSYTKMDDPRYRWGSRLIRLTQTDDQPTKFGALVKVGYVGHWNDGAMFIKTFGYEPEAEYVDFGCNFEAFTRHDMLEVETLGPLATLAPGDSVKHRETWLLTKTPPPPDNEDDCAEWLQRLAGV